MSEQAIEGVVSRGRVNRIVLAAAIGLVVVAAVGVFLVVRFVESERQRDLQSWQVRMGIVADTRAAAVTAWLDQQFATLQELAENASLQLYMTELQFGTEDAEEGPPPEASYLRNLLDATAKRARFTAPAAEIDVAANVERLGLAGIALTDVEGNIIVSTPAMPAATPEIRQGIITASQGRTALVDVYLGNSQQPTMGFLVPVYAIQGDVGEGEPIGLVIGIKMLGEQFYRTLEQPGETARTAENYLVREVGATVEYLSPLRDGTEPLRRSLAIDTPELAAAFVINTPGGFATRTNYAGEEVLVTGRALAMAPWYLVRTVQTAEALTEIESRSRTLLTVFLLVIVGISIALVAVWRHGTSLRAAEAAERFRITAEQFRNVTQFLRVVTDGLPDPIVAVDGEGTYTFANMAAARPANLHPREMIGKAMSSVVGPVRARALHSINVRVIAEQRPISEVHEFEEADGTHIVETDHLPLPATRTRPAGALVLFHDVTEITAERRRRERTLRDLVQTLVGVVDRRDPFSADHSARVAEVGRAIATEMGLDEADCDTIEIAGNLINFGKLLVPRELLTKTENLTEAERETLRNSVQLSADLLEGVTFDGPVVPIIRQVQERWDGTGPRKLAGEEIEVGARVIAVANAFVGMASARAYRAAMSMDDVCHTLTEQAGTVFDRRPVSALINYLDNRGGREQWAQYGEPPEEPPAPSQD